MRTSTAGFIFVAIFGCVTAQSQKNDASFELVDSNNDGKLSEKELVVFMKKRGRPDGVEFFSRFDLDRNGHLDISEFVPLVYELSRRPVDLDYQFFRRMDANDDGIVDTNEVQSIRRDNNDRIIDGILSIADTNHDGQLTYEEFKSHLGGEKTISPSDQQKNTALQLLAYIDSNGDNKVDPKELYTFSQRTATNKVTKSDVEQIFAMLDRNFDGYLSESELIELARQFSSIGNIRNTIPKV